MRRFIITSPLFTGQAEAIYNDNGMLCKIDLSNCEFNQAFTNSFKSKVPVHESDIATAFDTSKVIIVEADFEIAYDMFWKAYNRKINNKRCIPLWNKLGKTEQVKAYYGIAAYDKYLSRETWRGKVDPENYLRNQMWENEWK